MELRTGRLMALAAGAAMAEGWAQVPADLKKLAQAKMRAALFSENNPPAQVNMRGHHPLARWGRDTCLGGGE